MSIIRSQIVVDLGFGDSGKGRVVDSLCESAPNPLVVRYNGGPQAGHTVLRDGKRHTFSSFGSGTLQGVPSFFGPKTLIYPPNLVREYRKLQRLNGSKVQTRLYIDPRAQVITPADIALCRVRERIRNHGSCGIGVGTTMARIEQTPYRLPAAVLGMPELANAKMGAVYDNWSANQALALTEEREPKWWDMFQEEFVHHRRDWENGLQSFNALNDVFILPLPEVIRIEKAHMLIFEGAQGVMLDRYFGSFPNVTYADTTSRNAWEILVELNLDTPADVTYVHRCYTTRHGNGWMPSEWGQEEIDLYLENLEHEYNATNDWQGRFRRGEVDWDLVEAALRYDQAFHRSSSLSNLVVTCMDQRPDFRLPVDRFRDTWGIDEVRVSRSPGHHPLTEA
jgi:adenylosuccinate synthase